MLYSELKVPRRSTDKSCPKCAELWAAYDAASRKYIDLIKEQASIAASSVTRSYLLDPLIETAFQRRRAARSALEFHRVLDHGTEQRTRTAGS
jgi:hypothetical protein